MTKNIRVRLRTLPDRSYLVTVREGIVRDLPGLIASRWKRKSVFIITDSNVKRLYGNAMLRSLTGHGVEAWLLDFPPGERSKNAGVVFSLHSALLLQGIRRDSLIVALGGGVVGDVAGYVAATVLRGVRYIQVPTTLLAQVDSSIGGKVGVDHPVGKNLIGAFHQPSAVYIDPRVLSTLPAAEFRNGLAEMVKIGAALDRKFFAMLERSAGRVSRRRPRVMLPLISHAVRLKQSVVEKDEFESDLRKTLNLGHTIGHAVEAAENYSIRHGAAVSIGLAAEACIAAGMGLLKEEEMGRLVRLLRSLGLPTKFPPLRNPAKFLEALSADKKSVGASPRFVLLKSIGTSIIGVDVPSPFLLELIGR